MGLSKADRWPGKTIPGQEGRVPGSLDASPTEWVAPDVEEPTSRYQMPALPHGYDWLIEAHGPTVTVTLRHEFKRGRSQSFQFADDPYVTAAMAEHAAESILRGVGPLTQLDLSCLEGFTPGTGVVGE